MQATNSGTANPLLKQASTTGASFWSILASTNDLATPVGRSAGTQSGTAQQSNATASTQTSPSDQNTQAPASSQTAVTLPAQQSQTTPLTADAKVLAANATLLQTVSMTPQSANPVQRRTSDNGKPNNNASDSAPSTAVIPTIAVVTPQIPDPVRLLVTVPPTSTASECQNSQNTNQTNSASAQVPAQSAQVATVVTVADITRGSVPVATPLIADPSAQESSSQQSAPTTSAPLETVNTSAVQSPVSATARTIAPAPVPTTPQIAAPQVQKQTANAVPSRNTTAALHTSLAPTATADTKTQNQPVQTLAASPTPVSTKQQPTAPAPAPQSDTSSAQPAATTQTNGTDAKPQTDATKHAANATIIDVGLPQILMANSALAATNTAAPIAAAAMSSAPSTIATASAAAVVIPQTATASTDPSGVVKAGQTAVSSTGSSTASTSAASATTANSTTPAADKSSAHTSGNSDNQNQSQNQTTTPAANAAPQHASDAAQAATAKSVDTGAAALQSVPHSAASGQLTSDHSVGAVRTAETPRMPVPVPADTETAASSGVNAAHLIQTLGQTGMQVGMHSAEFGDITIRTLVSQQQMTAQISVDHSDLGRAIAAHVPTVQAKLGDDFGLHASIQVNHGGASFSGEQGSSSAGQQKAYRTPAQTGSSLVATHEIESAGVGLSTSQSDRLDIQA